MSFFCLSPSGAVAAFQGPGAPQKEKAVKHIIPVAVLIGAVPALLFGQVTVDCPEETCQIAPYYVGNGGFVGEAANEDDEDTEDVDESEVSFHVVCGNVTISDVVVTVAVDQVEEAIPSLPEGGLEVAVEVNCPDDSAASAAAELVPENPFPVDG